MKDFSSCSKCYYETTDPIDTCPHCGRQLQSSILARKLGWLLVVFCAPLTAFMVVAIILIDYMVGRTSPFGTSL
jgi:hypothetical protein